uniref:Quorum-sensing regulated protein QsrP n=1 Tax=Aliivibrio fischeri TaxID=668 RepID=Q9L6K9_ALIFS|nr:quorum-sensing regulated protein QsrP [Aliivibrio fischeri]
MKKISTLLLLTLISSSTFADNIYSFKSLSNLRKVPKVGDTYKLDPVDQASIELVCWDKGESDYRSFSACEIVVNYSEKALYDPCFQATDRFSTPPIYVELNNSRFSGLHVSGMKIKFKEIKYGNLFFELIK